MTELVLLRFCLARSALGRVIGLLFWWGLVCCLTSSAQADSRLLAVDGPDVRVIWLENDDYGRVLGERIDRAETSIHIVTYLFKISTSQRNLATQLCDRLIRARQRGVSVAVILELSDFNESLNNSNRFTLQRLKEAGIEVRFDSVERQAHAKLVVIDERLTFIGSHNFSHSALGRNYELSLLIESKAVAARALAFFQSVR
jgi:phosphatidylserine/phosphatidylglycerophosphate/cardiolipin synthase-like enzyme